MRVRDHRSWTRLFLIQSLTLLIFCLNVQAQSTASIEGQVKDQNGAVVPGVKIKVGSRAFAIERVTSSDDAGRYQVNALPVGDYRIEISAGGFETQVLDRLQVEVARRVTQNFQLRVGEPSEQVTVNATIGVLESAKVSVGSVTGGQMVQELPLNGRFFLDLGVLAPGSVTPPQNGFSTLPVRGSGSFAVNTAGNREDAVNYMINGITLNNQWFGSISFQPSINTVQEFVLAMCLPRATGEMPINPPRGDRFSAPINIAGDTSSVPAGKVKSTRARTISVLGV